MKSFVVATGIIASIYLAFLIVETFGYGYRTSEKYILIQLLRGISVMSIWLIIHRLGNLSK